MNYNIPQVGIAAVEVLEKAGFSVILANGQCCGRPMISKGLLNEAREKAQYNVSLLEEYVGKGIPIVGCEPSCLLTLRDEYPDLLGTASSKNVAQNSYMIEEFLSKLLDDGELELEFTDDSRKVLFHGHCHQKALIGTKASIKILNLPPNYEVEEIKSGCCGMTGAFGFEKEHYDISMAIGNQILFPAILSKDESWTVAITGISCRQQIDHGTKKKPQHVIEILHGALV
jgi:Fe-S oxidoreductase